MRSAAGSYLFVLIVTFLWSKINSKIFERCELARLLKYDHGFSIDEVANWVCIAHHQSGYNSSSQTGTLDNGAHGIFQISDQFWCSPPGKGWVCGVSCDRLRDDDLSDDLACIRQIYAEHQRISGDGFNAWTTYQQFCRGRAYSFIDGCFDNEVIERRPALGSSCMESYGNFGSFGNTGNYGNFGNSKRYSNSGNFGSSGNSIVEPEPPRRVSSAPKVYERCELARELRDRHDIPLEQIATWVCIAKHESNFNTSAIGRLNADGSEDHGLFQISDIYWCSPPGKGWACGLPCDKLEDQDISDDVECMKKIYAEHTRISGNGFTAWSVYQPHCSGRSDHFIDGCFNDGDDNSLNSYLASPSVKVTTQAYFVPPKKSTGKIYTPCELAHELRTVHRFPEEQIATWVCITKHESDYNTAALGSGDHGLFQISDIYWCTHQGRGKACGISCGELRDSDITDDVQCVKTIYEEHQRLSGDGFNAWVVYPRYCKGGRAKKYIESCGASPHKPITPTFPKPAITAPTKKTTYSQSTKTTGFRANSFTTTPLQSTRNTKRVQSSTSTTARRTSPHTSRTTSRLSSTTQARTATTFRSSKPSYSTSRFQSLNTAASTRSYTTSAFPLSDPFRNTPSTTRATVTTARPITTTTTTRSTTPTTRRPTTTATTAIRYTTTTTTRRPTTTTRYSTTTTTKKPTTTTTKYTTTRPLTTVARYSSTTPRTTTTSPRLTTTTPRTTTKTGNNYFQFSTPTKSTFSSFFTTTPKNVLTASQKSVFDLYFNSDSGTGKTYTTTPKNVLTASQKSVFDIYFNVDSGTSKTFTTTTKKPQSPFSNFNNLFSSSNSQRFSAQGLTAQGSETVAKYLLSTEDPTSQATTQLDSTATTTTSPRTNGLFNFLLGPLPSSSQELSSNQKHSFVTRSVFDDIFDRFKH